MSARVLVVGASGLVGTALLERLGSSAVGTYASRPFAGGVHFDALEQSIEARVDVGAFSHAVILLGTIDPEAVARDPSASRRLNVDAVASLVETLAVAGVVPLYTSSEVVFDGARGSYVEEDQPNPLFLYARQKVEVEQRLGGLSDFVVARLGRVFGSMPGDGTLFDAFLQDLRANRAVRVAHDQVFSPLHVTEAADALARLIEGNQSGTFHLGGPRALSRADAFALALDVWRDAGRTYTAQVETIAVDDLPTSEPRPRDVSLLTSKLVARTGVRMRDPADWCLEIVGGAATSGT